jgi:SAM-dependent methyltransferase
MSHHHAPSPDRESPHAHGARREPPDPAALVTREFWDERYGSAAQIWSGNPNPRLVEHVADLPPGDALDVGCGEGADAIWLAARGWRVTAVDISTVALGRAARAAEDAGEDVAARISWRQADMLAWTPPPDRFDLVSAQYVHLPSTEREALHRRLAAAVRPGGRLLIVGHHPSDVATSAGRYHLPDFFYTAEDVGATLDPDAWEIVAAEAPGRTTTDPEGRTIAVRDAVLFARRRG